MSTQQDRRWWFSVQYRSGLDMWVQAERFETQEQAELYAAATGGHVLAPHALSYLLYRHYLRLSEHTK